MSIRVSLWARILFAMFSLTLLASCAADGSQRERRSSRARDSVDDEDTDRRSRRAREDPEPECRMGTDGRQACGFNCKMGTDGVMACADTPDGKCAMSTDGSVTCSELAARSRRSGEKEAECRMGTDGRQVCGYNCKMGTNGRMYCASVPNGRCAMNTDGTFTCP